MLPDCFVSYWNWAAFVNCLLSTAVFSTLLTSFFFVLCFPLIYWAVPAGIYGKFSLFENVVHFISVHQLMPYGTLVMWLNSKGEIWHFIGECRLVTWWGWGTSHSNQHIHCVGVKRSPQKSWRCKSKNINSYFRVEGGEENFCLGAADRFCSGFFHIAFYFYVRF